MGFNAKSADEVYYYAFRLDQRPRTLTDRFCLSLVVVNDTSPVCAEFLSRYFVELCHRTADRIRFIFFAELGETEAHVLSRSMHERLNRASWNAEQVRGGFLSDVLSLLRGSRRLNRPRPWQPAGSWEQLRPRGFSGVTSPEDTCRLLGLDRDSGSAVLGAGEAMRFAQRLGVGRHVPCILILTDIGSLQVELLPFGEKTPEEIYEHVRGWVDRFYELNQSLFERWRRVEEEIEQLQSQARLSLQQVRDWRDRAAAPWRQLTHVAGLIDAVSNLEPGDTESWRRVLAAGDDWSQPEEVRRACRQAREAFATLRRRLEQWDILSGLRERLTAAPDLVAVSAALEGVSRDQMKCLTEDTAKAVTQQLDAVSKDLQNSQATHPAAHVGWWYDRASHTCPSQKNYKRERNRWSCVRSAEPTDLGMEYQILLQALRCLPVFGDPDELASQLLKTLAAELQPPLDSPDWAAQTQKYRSGLMGYFRHCCETAPDWVRATLPTLTFADLLPSEPKLPTSVALIKALQAGTLPNEHPLSQVMKAYGPGWGESISRWQQKRQVAGEEARQAVLRVVEAVLNDGPGELSDWELVRGLLLGSLIAIQSILQAEVTKLESELSSATDPHSPINSSVLQQLHAALDEYERVVDLITYPHRHDPAVLTIQTTSSAPQAAAKSPAAPAPNPVDSFRKTLREIQQTEDEAAKLWAEIPNLPTRWTPAAKLTEAMRKVIAPDRLEQILSVDLGGSLDLRLREAVLERRVHDTLNALTDLELGALLTAVTADRSTKDIPAARQRRIDLILTRVGADPRAALVGQDTVLRLLDEITARIDDLSDAEVIYRGTDVRRILEQYFKQFLALYGPLALTDEERRMVVNETLGPLTSLVARVLRGGGVADPRWQELAERVRATRQHAEWLEELRTMLPRLPQLTNCFPHHMIQEGAEMAPADRRQALAELIRSARRVINLLRERGLYPICLRFIGVRPDSMYTCRFEFESDPPIGGREVVAFSRFPPVIPEISGNLLGALYRQVLLMMPFSNPDRIDPLLAPLVPA